MIPESIGQRDQRWVVIARRGRRKAWANGAETSRPKSTPFFVAPEAGDRGQGRRADEQRSPRGANWEDRRQPTRRSADWDAARPELIGSKGWSEASGETQAVRCHNERRENRRSSQTRRSRGRRGRRDLRRVHRRAAHIRPALPPRSSIWRRSALSPRPQPGPGCSCGTSWDTTTTSRIICFRLRRPDAWVAAGATKLPPAVAGAAGERAAQGAGYEPTSKAPSSEQWQAKHKRPEPF